MGRAALRSRPGPSNAAPSPSPRPHANPAALRPDASGSRHAGTCTLLPMLMPTLATTAIATPARTSPKPSSPLASCAQVSVALPPAICANHGAVYVANGKNPRGAVLRYRNVVESVPMLACLSVRDKRVSQSSNGYMKKPISSKGDSERLAYRRAFPDCVRESRKSRPRGAPCAAGPQEPRRCSSLAVSTPWTSALSVRVCAE